MSEAGKPIDQYVVAEFKLSADIDGMYVTDIVSITGNFALNSIPNATLTLASGVEAISGSPASAHYLLRKLRMRAPVKVYLEIKPTDGALEKQPLEKMLIFEGYYAGFGFQRSNDNANYALHLVHWIDDLNMGSMLSRNWFPSAPFSLVENASSFELSAAGGSSSGALIAPRFGDAHVTFEKIQSNFWGESLRPILDEIATWPSPSKLCEKHEQGKDPRTGKNLIQETLKRILGNGGEAGALGVGEYFTPLALDGPQRAGLNGTNTQLAVQAALTNVSLAAYKYSTFWSKLTGEWGPMFFFAVSPSVDFAQVVPFFAGNREPHAVIEADEYGQASFSGHMAQIIEGVDIFWPPGASTGIYRTESKHIPNFCDPLGSFPPRDGRDYRGTVLVKEPPGWIQNYVRAGNEAASPDTTRITRADGSIKSSDELQRELEGKTFSICDLFAEQWYKTEVLSARYGELSGKLRFDIAPGSTVQIKAPRKNMPGLGEIMFDMFATVTRVSFVINSERAQAGTAFALAHMRSEDENQSAIFAGSTHGGGTPLYAQAWKGGPLVSNTGFGGGNTAGP
jgi:hypothetical protein